MLLLPPPLLSSFFSPARVNKERRITYPSQRWPSQDLSQHNTEAEDGIRVRFIRQRDRKGQSRVPTENIVVIRVLVGSGMFFLVHQQVTPSERSRLFSIIWNHSGNFALLLNPQGLCPQVHAGHILQDGADSKVERNRFLKIIRLIE